MRRPTKHRTKSGFYRNDEHSVSTVVYRERPVSSVIINHDVFAGLRRMFGLSDPPGVPETAPVALTQAPGVPTPKPDSQGVKQTLRRTQNR